MPDKPLPGWYPDPQAAEMERWWDGDEWGRTPDTRRHARGVEMYRTFVNKGSINMGAFQKMLNAEWQAGWAVHTVLEQHGNTMVIFQRRGQ